MPVILPTPSELAVMPWHKRDKVLRALRAYEREVGMYVEPVTRTRRSAAGKGLASQKHRAFGEQVRKEAKRLERQGWGK